LQEGYDEESKPEGFSAEWFAKVIGEAGTKRIGEDVEDESEGMEEF